ncbi:MAG: hypothetical protein MJ246_06515, partial [Clostridia bacterium]|nr:hypothetical protein [Clostridia bacterium]
MKRKSRGLNPKRFLALFCALTVVLSSYTPVYADGEENPPAETVQEVPSEKDDCGCGHDHEAEEAERLAAEQAAAEEAARVAAEEAQKAEAARIAAEEAKKAEQAAAEEAARQAEEARIAAEKAAAEQEAARQAEEAKKAEEAKAAEEAKKAEEAKATEEAKKAEVIPEVKEEPSLEKEAPADKAPKKMTMLSSGPCKHPQGQCTEIVRVHNDCGYDGYVEYYCKKCKSNFREILPATGEHSYDNGVITTDPTCTTKGVKTFTCKVCKTTRTEDVELADHVSVEVPAKANSCTEDGMTAGHKCSVCGTILDGCQTIPMSNHNYEEVGEVKPTCTADGHTAGTKCSVCGEVLSGCEVLEKTEHDFEVIEQSDPICGKEDGHISYHCKNCEYFYDELIEAKQEHDYEDIPEKKATCTEGGHSAYQKCKNCGYIPVEPTNTPPFGGDHMY